MRTERVLSLMTALQVGTLIALGDTGIDKPIQFYDGSLSCRAPDSAESTCNYFYREWLLYRGPICRREKDDAIATSRHEPQSLRSRPREIMRSVLVGSIFPSVKLSERPTEQSIDR